MLVGVRWRYVLALGAIVLAGCSGNTTRTASGTGGAASAQLVGVGEPVPERGVEVGSPGTLQLRAADPGRSAGPPLLATLIRPVPREPRDVCFGIYAANESPEDGDVVCQVRGADPLISSVGEAAVPGRAALAAYVLGQVPRTVTRVELVGPDGTRPLPLSPDRMFLAQFAPSARGQVQLVAELADGHRFARAFALPLSSAQLASSYHPSRRPGAVFNDEVGESIVGRSYRQIVRRFGAPLETFHGASGERCAYYDVVGYENGWVFCFKHGVMDSALGNQAPPAGVR